VSSSWLAGCIRRHLPAGTAPDPVSLRESLGGLLTDPRKPRGKRHPLPWLVSVMVAGVASGHDRALAVAQAAAGGMRASLEFIAKVKESWTAAPLRGPGRR
jgi:hypothetical protein